MGKHNRTFEERLEERSIPEPNSGCLLWTGAVDHSGHGVFSYWENGRSITTSPHRLAYQLYCGTIPDGKQVRHRCDVPSCINPAHLLTGTHQDNMDDMAARKRANGFKPGSNHRRSKLTEEDVKSIRASSKTGIELARQYKISTANVSVIRSRKAWTHVVEA